MRLLRARGAAEEERLLGVLDGLGGLLVEGALGAGVAGFSVNGLVLIALLRIFAFRNVHLAEHCDVVLSPRFCSSQASSWKSGKKILEMFKSIVVTWR